MPTTDLPIPPVSAIQARIAECRESAVRLGDELAIRHLDTLAKKLPHARLCWQLGVRVVGSPSGGRYEVTRAGCSCLNGQAGKFECWHWHLHEVLTDMFTTEVETADAEADEAEYLSDLFAQRLEATMQIIDKMRRAQHR